MVTNEELSGKLDIHFAKVMDRFADGEKRMDKQDIAIADIKDQIKGNPDRGVEGIRPALTVMKEQNKENGNKLQKQIDEHQKVLVIPILISKIPKGFLWVIGIIMLEGIAEMAHVGIVTILINALTK